MTAGWVFFPHHPVTFSPFLQLILQREHLSTEKDRQPSRGACADDDNPYDVKTSSMNTWDFNKAFIRFRYDIQADLYSYLIRKFISKHNEYLDYKVLPFTFIVLAPNGHVFAEYNPEESVDSQFYKENMNWRQLYEKAQWHLSTGITNMTQETYENGGVLKLKL